MVTIYAFYLNPESTINAINNTAKYGLENLNKTHDDFSDGFAITHNDKISIKAPDAIAVYKYISLITGFPSCVKKNGTTLKSTITNVDMAITLADVFSDCTAVSIGTFTLL